MSLDKLLRSDVMYRVVVVLLCVIKCNVNGYDEENILQDIATDEVEYLVVESAFKRWNSMVNTENNKYTSKDYRQREYYVYKDSVVLDNVCHYLKLCCEKYMEDKTLLEDRKRELQDIFAMFSYSNKNSAIVEKAIEGEKSVEDKTIKMVEFIEKYRNDVLHELDKK